MSRDRPSGPNVTSMSVAEALRHLAKAHEYLRAAQRSLADGDLDAAGGNAVLAGINAADCVSGLVQGNRWNGPHEQAAGHVRRAGEDGRAVAGQLAKLIRKKTQAHYEQTALRQGEATALVQAAERAVANAERAAARYRRRT